uniref:FAD dependent oxidoreductase domain-containing protein n=1 Tax=Aureoumbra lagunensis TaxID=44058 RepID=A0A7S3JVF4_9STRA|mmetsp:Transcript_23546/g.29362  ORF Transcript_23546/g.29362 Transcript_23546/m.29362 type:complete len:453 (-) Transcript_23546:207-1565(-)
MYDFAVVGNGLIGSAAAKYLVRQTGDADIVLIGPERREESKIFDCHDDEARICRRLDVDDVWAELATRSMARYNEIQKESGIQFHYPCGCLAVGRRGGTYLNAVSACAARQGVPLKALSEAELKSHWPELRLDATLLRDFDERSDDKKGCSTHFVEESDEEKHIEYAALYEEGPAGHISPTNFLRAQLLLFTRLGGHYVHGVVERLSKDDDCWKVDLGAGKNIFAKKVLVATNAWTNFRPLLKHKLALTLTTQTAMRRRVRSSNIKIPAIIVRAGSNQFGSSASFLDACYFLPPVNYDNDDQWVKIGHGTYFERPLASEEEAIAWYQGYEAERADCYARCDLSALLQRLCGNLIIKDNDFTKPHTIPIKCVIPKTPSKRPYLAYFDQGLVACVGCNGYAAKSSDELGRLSALLLLHNNREPFDFGPNIPPDAFDPIFATPATAEDHDDRSRR